MFEYRASDKSARWTAPGDTAGPWVPLQVGEMKFESGSVDQWLRVVVLSLLRLPTTDKTVAIQTYSLISSTTRWSSVTVDVCSRLKKHRRTDVARLGAGGAPLPAVDMFDEPYKMEKDCDALMVVTEWNELKQLDLGKLKGLLKSPVIYDGRNIYDPRLMREMGFTYRAIGR